MLFMITAILIAHGMLNYGGMMYEAVKLFITVIIGVVLFLIVGIALPLTVGEVIMEKIDKIEDEETEPEGEEIPWEY